MKKVINIILLVVLGVSLSGCEWWDGPGFGVDGGSDGTPSMNSIMTEIGQHGCEGEVVDFLSFVVGRNNIEDSISPVININTTHVKFDEMKKDGKDSVAMNVKINGKEDAFKFYSHGGDPVRGIKMESFIETVHTFGSKYDNNHSYEWESEFFLWDAFYYNGDKYIVLLASKFINIEFYSPKGQILKSEEVEKKINEGEEGIDFKKISVIGSMSGVDKTAYVIDNRVYIRNSLNRWSYFCNYSVSSSMFTNRVETMILIKVTSINDNSGSIVSVEKKNGKYYFTQTQDSRNINRFFLAPYN